ncbi:MAG: alpha-N-acetylglucosaminidase [Phycisphaeraceae bacterium]|nr:alpha-N-acetylglucosaminidase [Phycisphaeraceae bacterium]
MIEAIQSLTRRLLPPRVAGRFIFEVIPTDAGRDVLELESSGEHVVIRGSSIPAMAAGLNHYLHHHCGCHFSCWCGDQLQLPDPLPRIEQRQRHTSWARYRYFLNYCCFGYSMPWWDWSRWERLIDWMALHGVNLPLMIVGQEATWRAVCLQLGMSEQQVTEFLAGPPYLPFQWMGCLDSFGSPIPADWIDRRAQLGQRILARQRELGMTPVLQGFTGHIPAAVAQLHPQANVQQIQWFEWTTHLLHPVDPLFARIGKLWMTEQTRLFGTDHFYAADTFIEMVPPSGDTQELTALSRAIDAGMRDSDAQAVWVLQSWPFYYKRDFWTLPRIEAVFEGVQDEHMLVLDLYCEKVPLWGRTQSFFGKPWLWCNIQSFGRNVLLQGALETIGQQLPADRQHPDIGNLAGVGIVNEGLDDNSVVHDLLFESAWRDDAVDLQAWLRDYPRRRYGLVNEHAEKAWLLLGETVYTGLHKARSIIDHAPRLESIDPPPYELVQLAEAWGCLMRAAGELRERDTYRFDLVNVARQVLSNHAAKLHQRVIEAWRRRDAAAFEAAAAAFLQLFDDMDDLLATRREFLLGDWVEQARSWGGNDGERERQAWNALRVLTTWGDATLKLRDYARKEWSGLVGRYYRQRWGKFLDMLGDGLASGREPQEDFDSRLWQWEKDWASQPLRFNTQPRGDSVTIAASLWSKYAADLGAATAPC